MEILKLTSIRLSKSSLSQAAALGRGLGCFRQSDVLRVAIWIGLKFLKPGVIHEFMHMMWQEEVNGAEYCAADVLRTAGEMLENHKSLE